MSPDRSPYALEAEGGTFRIRDGSGNAVLDCGDAVSAEHWVTLLNRAYRQGYREGYRDAREA